MTVTLISAITLDGAVQAPGLPDEDTRDRLAHGSLGVPYATTQNAAWGEIIASLLRRSRLTAAQPV